jgi:aconitate hydratase
MKGMQGVLRDIRGRIARGDRDIPADVDGKTIMTVLDVSDRQRQHLLAGGTLNYVRKQIGAKQNS